MRMKRFFGGAFGLLALVSCSNDELTSVNRDGDEIAFNVVTNSPTRAADVYCNNNKPTQFEVWAEYNNATYINGDVVKFQDKQWKNTSGTRYWPDTRTSVVDFFAHHNAKKATGETSGGNFSWNEGAPEVTDFTVANDVASQKDFVYAVKTSCRKGDSPVSLNFRHALSQVVFRAKNTNANLHVDIKGVTVCRVYEQGKFSFPTSSTDTKKYGEHNGALTNIDYTSGWGTWEKQESMQDYEVSFNNQVEVPGNGNVYNLTASVKENNDPDDGTAAMLLLPQDRNAWNDVATVKPSEQDGTYFLVNCRIFNVAGTAVDRDEDVCLWGNKGENGYKKVAIPVGLNWEQGKKYIYTFVFGDGNGGYDPEGPTPVLVPITFNVTVDDFVPVNNEDNKMDEPEESQPASAA